MKFLKGLGTKTALLKEFSDAPTAPPDPFLRIPWEGAFRQQGRQLALMFVWGWGTATV